VWAKQPELLLTPVSRSSTGLCKVPALKGVWHRDLYNHDGYKVKNRAPCPVTHLA
jgi:hypothetical protein